MMSNAACALALALSTSFASAETVLGVYMFHRHGDRTAKLLPPANLTDLGYAQVFQSGQYYRSRYVLSNSSSHIAGINEDVVRETQLVTSAPADTVLQNSALGFLQGLYPPVGDSLGSEALANGSSVTSPLGGFQLIPVGQVSAGASSENNAFLQSTSNCYNAEQSSNEYFYSPAYTHLLNSTMPFYQMLEPVINGTLNASQASFKNAYTIFDLINVAEIHNSTINGSSILTDDVLHQVRTLADTHEFNLAWNASSPIRAIAGKTLAAQVVTALNATITGKGATKLNMQFGAYNSFQSYFGLADLTAANPDFYGVPDYSSSMVWELFTNDTVAAESSAFPAADALNVRFLYNNGSSAASLAPVQYPLFGTNAMSVSWADFVAHMAAFSVGSQQDWCAACGNSTGMCSPEALGTDAASGSAADGDESGGSGISNAVAGVIGAMVTLAVVLLVEGLVLLLFGLRLVSKKRLVAGRAVANGATDVKA